MILGELFKELLKEWFLLRRPMSNRRISIKMVFREQDSCRNKTFVEHCEVAGLVKAPTIVLLN